MLSGVKCEVCPHGCVLSEGQTGLCKARQNKEGAIVSKNYGHITAMALDPIEKKPLYRFMPGSYILSVGSFGCNLRCPFCQNHDIACADMPHKASLILSPSELTARAKEYPNNIGVAFTYNEPLIGYEYVLDCAKLLRRANKKVVLVTNGYINQKPLLDLVPYVDAVNIDLKGFSEEFYKFAGARLAPVLDSIKTCFAHCHVEITTLIVPDKNDSVEEMREMSAWIAGIDKGIPLHVSRFFPRYKMIESSPTPVKTVYSLAAVAREQLTYVYEGNC